MKAPKPNRNNHSLIPRIFLTGLLLLLFAIPASAQGKRSNAAQWQSVGGNIVASGTHDFTNFWYSAGRYHVAADGMFWKNNEDKKNSATHTSEEVSKDVLVKKNQISVHGPGFIASFIRKKKGSVGAKLTYTESGKDFVAASLGGQDLLKGNDGNWRWYDKSIRDFDPTRTNGGWIPAGETITLEVWAYNNYTSGGIWWRGYAAPKGVEYEFWFFPRPGGKIVKLIKYGPNGEEIDITDGEDPCQDLKKTLAEYMYVKQLTQQSINDFQKQLDRLNSHSAFNTGYLNEYQNNTLGDDPNWNKKNSYILDHGAGGGTASYLINKEKWKNQVNKSIQLQSQNLWKTDTEIARVKREIQQQGCK